MDRNVLIYEFPDICEEKERERCSAAKGNGDKVQLVEANLIHIVAALNNGIDLRLRGSVEQMRIYVKRTSRERGDEVGDGVDIGSDERGSREDEGLHILVDAGGDVLLEDVVEHGHADDLADGADDDGESDGRADVLWG